MIESLQQECADELSADPFFDHIPVFVEHLGDISNKIDRALGPIAGKGGKSGACVIILTPTADVNFEEVFGPFFDEIPIVALVTTNPIIADDATTGVAKTALEISEKVAGLLHQFHPLSANGPLVAAKPTIARGPNTGDDESMPQYNVRFKTSGGLTSVRPQIETPVIVFSAFLGKWTISCATPGAAIFYTLDGKNPSPRSGTFYTDPLDPPTHGTTLKARAWLAGYLASETATQQF